MLVDRYVDSRTVIGFTAIAGVVMMPFAVYHLAIAGVGMSILVSVASLTCLGAAVAIYYRPNNASLRARVVLLVVVIYNLACFGVLYARGGPVALWVYCVILANFYLLRTKAALAINMVVATYAVGLLYGDMSPDYYFRFLATLPICMFFSAVFGHAITRQRDDLRRELVLDSLTGARNRRTMHGGLEGSVERMTRYGEPASLIMLDLDHFKEFNDEFGHMAGDRALKAVVDILLRATRKVDSVYRYGGEEFIVLLPHAETAEAVEFAERIQEELERVGIGPRGNLTVSFGVAGLSPEQTTEDWIRAADRALYAAKAAGRNTIRTARGAGESVPVGGPVKSG